MKLSEALVNFFGLGGLETLRSAHHLTLASFKSIQGIEAVVSPIFPAILMCEIAFLAWAYHRSPNRLYAVYKIPVLMYAFNWVLGMLINIDVFLWTQRHFAALAPFTAPLHVVWFFYAYVVWELSHFVYHWTCHKVRLLWVLHSPHHAPTHMNLGVIFAAFFLQGTYANFIRTAICSILGVPMELLILCMVIDACWGSLIHFSEELWPSGKSGSFLDTLLLMPSDHRVHHSSNPEYIDTNYCNALPIWDKLFGTLRREIPEVRPRYGLSRPQKPNNFTDTYFGELSLLWRDIRHAESWKKRMLLIVMPPGWGSADH